MSVHDLSITKRTDIATPKLMQAFAKGNIVKEALLTVRNEQRDPLEFIRIEINDVIVDYVSTTSNFSEGSIAESVALKFSKVQVDYVRQKPDGTAGETSQFKWDFSTNTPFFTKEDDPLLVAGGRRQVMGPILQRQAPSSPQDDELCLPDALRQFAPSSAIKSTTRPRDTPMIMVGDGVSN